MLLQGFFYKASHGFTIGLPLYISNTAGAFSTTRPTGTNDYVRIIGYATSANYIYFDYQIKLGLNYQVKAINKKTNYGLDRRINLMALV